MAELYLEINEDLSEEDSQRKQPQNQKVVC